MHEMRVRVGPAAFRLVSTWRAPMATLAHLYAAYPVPDTVDFTVRLEPVSLLRRFVRPAVALGGDYMLTGAAPLPLAHGVLGAEMAMNLQMALGWRRQLILHASAVERDGRVLIMTGESGSGKSTLSAMLGQAGWRFLGDEFVLIDGMDGTVHPFPRPISLKNGAIARMEGQVSDPARFGPRLIATPKGDIRHLIPPADAIARMDERARPAMVLYPRFGADRAVRVVGKDEHFMRLTQASTNYVALGETGFAALSSLVVDHPAYAIDYPSGEEALALVEQLWSETI